MKLALRVSEYVTWADIEPFGGCSDEKQHERHSNEDAGDGSALPEFREQSGRLTQVGIITRSTG